MEGIGKLKITNTITAVEIIAGKNQLMDAEINGHKYDENQNICKVAKHHSTRFLLITKGKSLNFTKEKPSRHNLNQVVKVDILVR